MSFGLALAGGIFGRLNEIVKEIDDHNDKIIKDREKEQADKMEEAKDRVAFAHHQTVGGYRGRLY